jgi:mannosyltransferase OCH1-like enzyme
MVMNIPKNLWHVWIGPNPAPKTWMDTWPEKHPDWDYKIIDNNFIANKKFYNQHLIDGYLNSNIPHKYAGAADLIRYEILYEYGGFIAEADSICLENTDDLWTMPAEFCYSVYESETFRPGYISPILSSNSKNDMLLFVIENLNKLNVDTLKSQPVHRVTGNYFLKELLRNHTFNIKIFPSYYFIPCHFSNLNIKYTGKEKVYADQLWGSTRNLYKK